MLPNGNSDNLETEQEPADHVFDDQIRSESLAVPDHIPPPEELIEKGQYLVDCPSWLAFIGENKHLQYTKHFINRNDKIWELISTEIRYVDLLVVIRDVFMKAFPPQRESSLNLADNLFPHLDDVLECHNRLLYFMLEVHNANPEHITKNLGQCFTTALTENTMYRLIEAYGALMFVQNSLTDSLNKLKVNRNFAEKLTACERDPRTKRRTITDCYLIIIQRWTKIETLLAGIISDTIVHEDSTELNDLNASRRAAQSLLLGAQQKLTDLVHADKLCYFAENLKEDWYDLSSGDNSKHRTLREWMTASDAKLINTDKLSIQTRKEGGKVCNIELHGVALKDCFFLLRQDPETGKFSLFRESSMPPILIWTKHFGYYRDQAGAPLTFIILMDYKNSAPTMTKFICSTHDEVARWQKVFSEGFDNFGKSEETELDENMVLERNAREIEAAEERRKRQEQKLDFINQLTADILSQWQDRNLAFRALFCEEGITTAASRSNSGRSNNARRSLTNQSDQQQQSADDELTKVRSLYDRFTKYVMQLANLCGESDGTCLSRSASDAADRRPSSLSTVMPPMPDGNGDSVKKRDKDNVTYRSKPKSQNRFSNLLRTGSRRRGEGSVSDFPRDYSSPDQQDRNSEVASDSSLICLTSPSLLVAEIQDLAAALMKNYEAQYFRCLELEKDHQRLRTDQSSINTKRELECLRSLQKKLEDDQIAWNAQKQKEEARLEREDQKLKNMRKNLEDKQEQYEKDSRTLQEQIDLHASRGIDVRPLRGSTTNLYSPDVDSTSLSHNPSTRSEGASGGHKYDFPASVPKEMGERRNIPYSPSTAKPRTASSENQYGRYGTHPTNYPTESSSVYHPNPVPSRPPAGPPHPPPSTEPPKHSFSSNTLGSLPTRLASKTSTKSRSSKSFLRH